MSGWLGLYIFSQLVLGHRAGRRVPVYVPHSYSYELLDHEGAQQHPRVGCLGLGDGVEACGHSSNATVKTRVARQV